MIIKDPAKAFENFKNGGPLTLVHGDKGLVRNVLLASALIIGAAGIAAPNSAQANPLGVSTQYSAPGEAPQFMKDAGASLKEVATNVSGKVSGTISDLRDSQKGGYDPKSDLKAEAKTDAKETKIGVKITADDVKDAAVTAAGVTVAGPFMAIGKGLKWAVNKAQAANMEKKPEQPAPQAPKW